MVDIQIDLRAPNLLDADENLSVSMSSCCSDELQGFPRATASDELDHGDGSSTLGESTTGRPQAQRRPSLTTKISKMSRWKAAVTSMLVVNAVLVITATTVKLHQQEVEQFEAVFYRSANTLGDAARFHSHQIGDHLQELGDVVTSFATSTHVEWPFFTMPDYEHHADHVRKAASLEWLALVPLVPVEQQLQWELYVQHSLPLLGVSPSNTTTTVTTMHQVFPRIYHLNNGKERLVPYYSQSTNINTTASSVPAENHYAPVWQASPLDKTIVNANLLAAPVLQQMFLAMQQDVEHDLVVSGMNDLRGQRTNSNSTVNDTTTAFLWELMMLQDENDETSLSLDNPTDPGEPASILLQPIYDVLDTSQPRQIVGFLAGILDWDRYWTDLLRLLAADDATGKESLYAVLGNNCGQLATRTWLIQGSSTTYLGRGDRLLDINYQDRLSVHAELKEFQTTYPTQQHCKYSFHLYPSEEFQNVYNTSQPALFGFLIGMVFLTTGGVVLAYMSVTSRRQNKVRALLSTMFPPNVREQVLKNAEMEAKRMKKSQAKANKLVEVDNFTGKEELHHKPLSAKDLALPTSTSKVIAEFSPEATVCFADIVGFTAWSSVREPTQVFELLECIYHAFDVLAQRRQVFKVETVGDCYVAVTGVPTPRKDHAQLMCRFARDCRAAMGWLVRRMEVELGPGTSLLDIRFGINSGSVTAGVLRGERSRFQLFGDTVGIAARMESTGISGKIQISQESAELLAEAGKSNWFEPRDDNVFIRDEVWVQTYFVEISPGRNVDRSSSSATNVAIAPVNESSPGVQEHCLDGMPGCHLEPNQRLAEWNSKQLMFLLNKILTQRKIMLGDKEQTAELNGLAENGHLQWAQEGISIVDEVQHCIHMPEFGDHVVLPPAATLPMILSERVQQQIHDFVSIICSMYKNNCNQYHNYQHAAHCTMSTVKLLSLLAGLPSNMMSNDGDVCETTTDPNRQIYERSFGIAADPMAKFTVAFASLIQDVDHPGVSNNQLIAEGSRMAQLFKNTCVAEQNSFHVAWDLLMDPSFKELRTTIYTNKCEFHHFRELLVSAVIATDRADKSLADDRHVRWKNAFDDATAIHSQPKNGLKEDIDRRATLVLETIIQTSDLVHMMQHWHIYLRFCERSFEERYIAFRNGRAESPCHAWYESELSLFDDHAIPLANRLKKCGAFGVCAHSYVNFANKNRMEWLTNGPQLVQGMAQRCAQKYNDKAPKTPSRLHASKHSRLDESDVDLSDAEDDAVSPQNGESKQRCSCPHPPFVASEMLLDIPSPENSEFDLERVHQNHRKCSLSQNILPSSRERSHGRVSGIDAAPKAPPRISAHDCDNLAVDEIIQEKMNVLRYKPSISDDSFPRSSRRMPENLPDPMLAGNVIARSPLRSPDPIITGDAVPRSPLRAPNSAPLPHSLERFSSSALQIAKMARRPSYDIAPKTPTRTVEVDEFELQEQVATIMKHHPSYLEKPKALHDTAIRTFNSMLLGNAFDADDASSVSTIAAATEPSLII